MTNNAPDFWTDEISVLLTSFWGWSPETWGTIGWTGPKGLARRTALLRQLTNPFIAVIYVTKNSPELEHRGKIVGFYLISHECGDRDTFTHPAHHDLAPGKWEHSLRAIRAFSYVPECRIETSNFDSGLAARALPVSKWCEVLTDRTKINRLRGIPWIETSVYVSGAQAVEHEEIFEPLRGFNRAGPANRGGYEVSANGHELNRQLYVLRLTGDVDAFLGKPGNGKYIYKIGLSFSPELRKQCLQSALPDGAFRWVIQHHSEIGGKSGIFAFKAAIAGEDAMKHSLASTSEWLGGEFYLASEEDLSTAWKLGIKAAISYIQN